MTKGLTQWGREAGGAGGNGVEEAGKRLRVSSQVMPTPSRVSEVG